MLVREVSEIRLRLGRWLIFEVDNLLHRGRAPVVGETNRRQALDCMLEIIRANAERLELRPKQAGVFRGGVTAKFGQRRQFDCGRELANG